MTYKLLPNVRVLDMSRVLAGPWAGLMLADYGAEVIKVERPGTGDDARSYGPPFLKDREGRDTAESPMFVGANRNKKSVTIDIARPEGQELIRKLAARSDILLENYKVGDLARYGLDYENLKQVNPRLIYCSVTGFGQTGPYSYRPGYDSIFQAISGLMSATGHPDDQPGGGPIKVGPSITDVLCGLYAASAILAALHHRDQVSGQGQHIDLSLAESALAAMSHYASSYLISGEVPMRRGNIGNGGMPSGKFDAADGAIMMVVGNDQQWGRMCEVIGCRELIHDPRFEKNAGRVSGYVELLALINPLFLKWKRDDLLAALDKAGIACGPIYNLAESFADPHLRFRGCSVEVPHPLSGTIRLATNPAHFSAAPPANTVAPPLLGQHTGEILRDWLGMEADTIAGLRAHGII